MSEEEKSTSVKVRDEIEKNSYIQVFGQENYPAEIREGISNVMNIVAQNKSISDLYPQELQEIPVSTSIFQDICVQMESHFTPQRKLRQALMELDSKLGALDSAKNNQKKQIVKLQQLDGEIKELERIYAQLEEKDSSHYFETCMLISEFTSAT